MRGKKQSRTGVWGIEEYISNWIWFKDLDALEKKLDELDIQDTYI